MGDCFIAYFAQKGNMSISKINNTVCYGSRFCFKRQYLTCRNSTIVHHYFFPQIWKKPSKEHNNSLVIHRFIHWKVSFTVCQTVPDLCWCCVCSLLASAADQPGPEHPAPERRLPAGWDPGRRGPGFDPTQGGQPHLHVLPGCSLHSLSNPVAPCCPSIKKKKK